MCTETRRDRRPPMSLHFGQSDRRSGGTLLVTMKFGMAHRIAPMLFGDHYYRTVSICEATAPLDEGVPQAIVALAAKCRRVLVFGDLSRPALEASCTCLAALRRAKRPAVYCGLDEEWMDIPTSAVFLFVATQGSHATPSQRGFRCWGPSPLRCSERGTNFNLRARCGLPRIVCGFGSGASVGRKLAANPRPGLD